MGYTKFIWRLSFTIDLLIGSEKVSIKELHRNLSC